MFLMAQGRQVMKMGPTTHLALFGPLVSFFFSFFLGFINTNYYI